MLSTSEIGIAFDKSQDRVIELTRSGRSFSQAVRIALAEAEPAIANAIGDGL